MGGGAAEKFQVSDDVDVRIDPWVLRHVLLSIDDRPRSKRDRADLEGAVRATVDALLAAPRPGRFDAPGGSVSLPAGCVGLPLWAFETNCWVLTPRGDGHDCIVIDVPPDVAPLVRYLDRHRLRVGAVLLTHAHFDHTGGVRELIGATGSPPVFVHIDDVAQVASPVGADAVLARSVGVRPPELGDLVPLVDGQRLVVAGVEVTARHVPGHTAGTTCYAVDGLASSFLVTGDQLFAGGIGRGDLPGGCAASMERAMADLVGELTDDVVVLPGHGPAATLGDIRRVNPYVVPPLGVEAPARAAR